VENCLVSRDEICRVDESCSDEYEGDGDNSGNNASLHFGKRRLDDAVGICAESQSHYELHEIDNKNENDHGTILFQLPILILGEMKPHPAAANIDPVADRLLGFEIQDRASTLCEFNDHVLAQECELLRERGFEILFKELAVPALPLHEAHVDPRHGESIGE
jgi:hypothetical protein